VPPGDLHLPDSLRLGDNLPELDRSIIRILQEDGRAPYTQVARQLGVSEKAVARRVERLLEDRLIEITTLTDPELFGYHSAAFVGIHCTTDRLLTEVLEDLSRSRAGDYAVITTGRYDLLVEILCRDASDMLTVVERDIRAVPGVRAVEILPYLRLHYQEPVWEKAQRDSGGKAGPDGPLLIDSIDRHILNELNTEGRLPLLTISQRLGISESQVRKRVARMTASGAVRIIAITNPASLGFETIAWLGVVAAPGHAVVDLADKVAMLPGVAYLAICAGRFDMLVEMVCRGEEQLVTLLDRGIRSLEGIAKIEVMICLELHYRRVHPVRTPPEAAAEELD
jgi:DNA-binding Lrp family transcriptional regulator